MEYSYDDVTNKFSIAYQTAWAGEMINCESINYWQGLDSKNQGIRNSHICIGLPKESDGFFVKGSNGIDLETLFNIWVYPCTPSPSNVCDGGFDPELVTVSLNYIEWVVEVSDYDRP